MKSSLSKVGALVLLVSVATACENADPGASAEGGSDTVDGTTTDANDLLDSNSTTDFDNSADMGSTADAGDLTDAGNTADAGATEASADAGNMDAGSADAGNADARNVDAGNADVGNADARNVDSGNVDAGNIDAGNMDAGNLDAGNMDAGTDAGTDAGMDAGNADAGDAEAGNMDAGGDGNDSGSLSPLPVNLGTAGNFVILSKSGIDTVPTSAITGNIGVSPAAPTAITGFALIADPSNVFSTSTQVTGKVYGATYTAPTPMNLTTAVLDMELAFTDAAGRAPNVTELGAGNIGGLTLIPGVYKWSTGLLIPSNVTLAGAATDVWIFQIAQNLTMSNGTSILLAGGAVPKNVFWEMAGAADLGTTAHFEGVMLSKTAINMKTGASINGRLLAQTAVTIASSTVVQPAP